LLINDAQFNERAEMFGKREPIEADFFRGEVDKYTWVDIGSSYLPSDMLAAFLRAQLEHRDQIRQATTNLGDLFGWTKSEPDAVCSAQEASSHE